MLNSKKTFFIVTAVFCLIALVVLIPYTKLINSYIKWKNLERGKSSYQYTVEFLSWTGFGSQTKIKVKDSKVVGREYYQFEQQGQKKEQYTEDAIQLGSHKEGAAIKVIPELYQECAFKVIPRSFLPNENLIINYHDSGVLNTCVTRNSACADDCSVGVKVSQIIFE